MLCHYALQFLEKQEFTETTSYCRCAYNMNTYKFNALLMAYMSGQFSSFYFFKLHFYHRTQILCRCGGSKFYIYQSFVPGYICRCSSTGKLAGHQAIHGYGVVDTAKSPVNTLILALVKRTVEGCAMCTHSIKLLLPQ